MTSEEYYGDDQIAIDILREKYLHDGEVGPDDMWKRVSKAIASVDKDPIKREAEFYNLMRDFKFIPGGRINLAAGFEKEGVRLPSLSNCYFIPIEEDSLEGIFDWCKNAALVYRSGGGDGVDIGVLRPKGSKVNASIHSAPGSVAFMNQMSETTETVAQSGRRGALMISMMADHPDIEDFIKIKSDTETVKHANISVKLTDAFMKAVEKDKNIDLSWNGKKYRTVKAKQLWDKIVHQAWAHAEPGLMFWDNIVKDHSTEYAAPLLGTNPCGEIPLPAYTACNLAHLNLSAFVDPSGHFWMDTFAKAIPTCVRFLDNVIEYNHDRHALEEIKKQVKATRKAGLGITGLGDALLKMGLRYDSKEAVDFVDKLFDVLKCEAYRASIELAKERESFPLFDADKYLASGFASRLPDDIKSGIREYGLRNSTLLTVAPVGTGSIIAQCSSGMEPIFQYWYDRDVKTDDGIKTYKVYHKVIRDLFGEVDDIRDLPEYAVTAHDVDPSMRIEMQAAIQKHVDSSISSTINLPESATKATVAQIYLDAWKAGLKGITVYREGSREGVLKTQSEEISPENRKRSFDLDGVTYKLPIQTDPSKKLYITINAFEDDPSRPFEIFINTYGDPDRNADMEALAMTLSALFRRHKDLDFLMDKFIKLQDPSINAWWYDKELGKGANISSIAKAIAIAYYKFKNRKKSKKKQESILESHIFCETCD